MTPLPQPNLGWNTYGKGIENVGSDGRPEPLDVPITPGPDQLLIRIDAVGLCFSDVKLVRQGGDHPKLYGRDLRVEPTRLGHEATVTVIEVGSELADKYHAGQRLAIQPDIHVGGKATAYGYTIPGGLIQYHVIGSEVLDADDGAYVIPVTDDLGYAAAALSEPWACVEASYTQRRRLTPLEGGTMWIVGSTDDATDYTFTTGLDAPDTIVLTDVSDHVKGLVAASNPGATVIERNGLAVSDYRA
ncbi:MAG: alcohol dehydrogenase catalytic domain-containing protein, partial [Acidimicrobiales bacterium]|nr:alcohol dehydrogenase catalytic domain-containing protein [Acidimicrobiales bacterium]